MLFGGFIKEGETLIWRFPFRLDLVVRVSCASHRSRHTQTHTGSAAQRTRARVWKEKENAHTTLYLRAPQGTQQRKPRSSETHTRTHKLLRYTRTHPSAGEESVRYGNQRANSRGDAHQRGPQVQAVACRQSAAVAAQAASGRGGTAPPHSRTRHTTHTHAHTHTATHPTTAPPQRRPSPLNSCGHTCTHQRTRSHGFTSCSYIYRPTQARTHVAPQPTAHSTQQQRRRDRGPQQRHSPAPPQHTRTHAHVLRRTILTTTKKRNKTYRKRFKKTVKNRNKNKKDEKRKTETKNGPQSERLL